MSYNTTVTSFAGGSVRITHHRKMVLTGDDRESAHVQKKLKDNLKMMDEGWHATEETPFDDVPFETPEQAPKDRKKQFNRTKRLIYDKALSGHWNGFVTLTFDPKKVDSMDYDTCLNKVQNWFHNLRKRYCPDLMYIVVPEQHKSGAYHFHALVGNITGLKYTRAINPHSGKALADSNGHPIYNLDGWRFGYSTLVLSGDSFEDSSRMSGYVTKYMTKDLDASLEGHRKFLASTNIPKPEVDCLTIEGTDVDHITDIIADSLAMKKTATKEVTVNSIDGFSDTITYISLAPL